ncbi:MAG: peptidylprolyl isomerase [Deltaproteobacteria bacterium]|nr:peptidylprolyl isomerase [Deltaproteobacteria bacterium]
MRKKLIKIFFILLGIIASFAASADTIERIVAIVGSDIITLYELDRAMAPFVTEINNSANKELKFKNVRSEVLGRLVDNLLLKQAIENSKIAASNDEIVKAIQNVLKQNHISIDVLKAELAGKGISYDSYKKDIEQNIQRIKFINQEIGSQIKISDEDMRDYYKKNMSQFGVNQSIHIAQIVLPFEQATTKEQALELKNQANDILKQARSGKSFAQLAKEYSKGPNAENGGDLGLIDPANLLPEISSALEKMKAGQISEPILSPAGYHIVYLIDRAQTTEADFDKLKDKIYDRMYEQRVMEELNQYIAEQKKKTYVEIRK